MQIQCPHCKSRYRLGSEMIDAYGGFVRCGNCNYKFNIHDQVILDDGPDELVNTDVRPARKNGGVSKSSKTTAASQAARIEPRLEREASEDEFNIRFAQDEHQPKKDPLPYSGSVVREPALEPLAQGVEDSALDDFDFPESSDDSDGEIIEDLSEAFDDLVETPLDPDNPDEESEAAISRPWPELDAADEPVFFDSLHDEGVSDEPAHLPLINDDAPEEPGPGFFSKLFSMVWGVLLFLFWTVAAIALAYLLFGQIKETLYPAYKNHALVLKIRSGVCAYLPCDSARYDKELFEIVVSRMDEVTEPARQLHIAIFVLNNAQRAQVYPNILLTLKTIDGSTVGQRVITPAEYFTSYDSLMSSNAASPAVDGALIKPNKLGKILIKLDKPPANAVGFEARVVK